MALINCGSAYYQDISGCIQTLSFELGLTPTTEYTFEFIFPNGFKVQKKFTTDGSGNVSIDKNEVLAGFWNDAIGEIPLTIYQGTSQTPVEITICETTYTQLVLNFQSIVTDDTTTIVPTACA